MAEIPEHSQIIWGQCGAAGNTLSPDVIKKINEIMTRKEEFRYQLLSRMQMDCKYFLGYGNRCAKHLWGLSVAEHIVYMKALWFSFEDCKKPEWLSIGEIQEYEKRMAGIEAK